MTRFPLFPRCARQTRGLLSIVAAALLLSPASRSSAALSASVSVAKVVTVKGSGTNTVTSVIYNADGTISLEAVQVGHLSHFGDFTGSFAYLAIPTPTALILFGTATLINEDGDQLFLSAAILELGTDYPYKVGGNLTITGGTGRFAGAKGLIAVSGTDTASLTDTLEFQGTLSTPR